MSRGRIVSKSEWVLLGITAVFLLCLWSMERTDRVARPVEGSIIMAEVEVPSEELTPAVVLIDINTADAKALETLPGIGEVLAQRIVAYRIQHGPFTSLEELEQVRGIGPAMLEELQGWITTGKGAQHENSGGGR